MYTDAVQIKTRSLAADMYYKNTLVQKYNVNYPWLESSEFRSVRSINRQYYAKAMALQQYFETSLYQSAAEEYDNSVANGYPIRMFEAVVNYNVTYNENCTLSLFFDQYEYTGGAHGMTVRYSDTWNLQYGRRIKLCEIYPANSAEITGVITAHIAKDMQSGEGIYFEDYEKNAAEYFNPENFYLNDLGLVIYFQLYELAPYASGIPEFMIPYSGSVRKPECKQM